MKPIRNEITRILLPVIFTGYILSISLFTHVHIVNGVTIVHSHPFKKSLPGNPSHSHTQNGFELIHLLTSFSLSTDAISCFRFEPLCTGFTGLALKPAPEKYNQAVRGGSTLRAPPGIC